MVVMENLNKFIRYLKTERNYSDYTIHNYELDITDERYHHEIYLSDPRKCDVNKLKTVIRHPIKKIK